MMDMDLVNEESDKDEVKKQVFKFRVAKSLQDCNKKLQQSEIYGPVKIWYFFYS